MGISYTIGAQYKMAQKFTTKEQALKHISQVRCGMVALWLICMIGIGSFKNSDIAGVTGLIVTIATIVSFYNEKKKTMEQINKLTSSTVAPSSFESLSAQPQASPTASKLINCPDCEKEVSRRAASCPNCGCPISSEPQIKSTSTADESSIKPSTTITISRKEKKQSGDGDSYLKLFLKGVIGLFAIVITLIFIGAFFQDSKSPNIISQSQKTEKSEEYYSGMSKVNKKDCFDIGSLGEAKGKQDRRSGIRDNNKFDVAHSICPKCDITTKAELATCYEKGYDIGFYNRY